MEVFHRDIKNGIVRGAITGGALAGVAGIVPATVLVTFLNVTSSALSGAFDI